MAQGLRMFYSAWSYSAWSYSAWTQFIESEYIELTFSPTAKWLQSWSIHQVRAVHGYHWSWPSSAARLSAQKLLWQVWVMIASYPTPTIDLDLRCPRNPSMGKMRKSGNMKSEWILCQLFGTWSYSAWLRHRVLYLDIFWYIFDIFFGVCFESRLMTLPVSYGALHQLLHPLFDAAWQEDIGPGWPRIQITIE